MIKYGLSKYISIADLGNDYDAIPAKYLHDHFIMYDRIRDSEYLITATVKYYIDKFSVYKTEEEVLKEVEEDLQSNSNKIGEACSRFFTFLCKAKILVPCYKIENDIIDEPLYKEGDIIDHLRILNILSSRRYTDVYSAIDMENDSLYVIKLLNRKKTLDDGRFQKELFEMKQEYKMLQKAKHIPAINKAYNFREDPNHAAYIILEYIDGKSLSNYMLDEAELMTNSNCLHITGAIINAFSCLHENNIIHGDIHSSNILVTKEKEIRIIDLGMSGSVEIEENKVLKSGGVYFYMPPERINVATFKKFSKEPDLVSDVYQVGLLLYLILYNTLPFDGFTWEELAQNIKEGNVKYGNISFWNFAVPAGLINIIKKCLDKQPSERYRNASEILGDFEKHIFAKNQLAEI